ncbi:MAG: putative RNA methyltransferase [Chloroflexota bacterium]
MNTIFQCPVCQASLNRAERQYQCPNGHSFDIAREGYVNLLLANQKKSKDPGDSKAMIRSRKAFLAEGHYQPLAESIVAIIEQIEINKPIILDAGCGEGYYTDFIHQHVSNTELYGIDIAKDAVRYASKYNQEIDYAVASISALPIQDNSVDCVISIFAPRDTQELSRVLKKDSILITATPALNHLLELRQMIYDDVRPYVLMDSDTFTPQFTQITTQQVRYQITLTNADAIANLLQMTPFYWHSPTKKQQALQQLSQLDLHIAFEVAVWRTTT